MVPFRPHSILGLIILPLALPAKAQTATIPTGQTLILNGNSQKCIDAFNGAIAAGTRMQQFPCLDGKNQQWQFVQANGGVLMKNANANFCIAPVGGGSSPQTELELTACDSKAAQQVWVIKANNNQFSFTHKSSSLCLSVKDQSMKDEVRLILNTCSQSQDQNWFFARNVANISSAQAGATKPNNNKPASGNGTDPTTPNPQPTTTPAPAPAAKPALNTTGKWSAPFDLGISATSMAILGNGKVLIWAASTPTAYGGGVNTKVMVFDPATNRKANVITTAKEGIYDSTAQEYFCESTSILPGGGTIIAGGAAASRTSSTDALGNWKANNNLNIPRGYAASTTTSKGQVLVLGGSWNNTPDDKKGELYTAGSGWKLLNNVSTNQNFLTKDEAGRYRADNHMWLFGASNGYVFHAGPSKSMHWIDTNGDGTVVSAGTRGNDTDAMNGNAVMYDIGKILAVNGSMNYDDDLAPSSNATLIDISKGPGSAPQTKSLSNLKFARKFGHSIVLPNGQVMIVGGAGQGNHPFSDTAAVLTPELWDPATEKAQTMANHAIPRTYHSIGFLTVDGRVMIAGGGLGANTSKGESVHTDAEIFTPPYLLNADGTDAARPMINSAPDSTTAGQTITVTSTGATSFTLVRVSSATHSLNNDQRRIPLSPDGTKSTNASRAANTKGIDTTILKIPDDRGIVLPGTYYLFALDNRGTPSIASMINIQ